ncbi:MAG TPA: dTDP-4-dehydrorhamnose reductase [Anaerolineales bacterium]
MRILLLGNTGQLGWELQRTLAPLGELNACDYPDLDLSDLKSFLQVFHDCQPDLLVNATAYTAVDRAEDEPDLAHAINAIAPGVMAEEARQHGIAFIHYSTDYVFDGRKGVPYLETDLPSPLSIYGRSKLAGEQAVQQAGGAFLILRTSWVYSLRRDSFVSKVLAWSRQQDTLRLVTDQVSGPTWARLLAEVTSQLANLGREDLFSWFSQYHGLYHLAGSGYCSRFAWGQKILELDPHKADQRVQQLLPALTSEFPTPAERPLFSALDCNLFSRTFHLQLPDWKFSLKLAMESM